MMKVRLWRGCKLKTEQVDIEFNLVFELLCKPKVRKVFRVRYSDAVLNSATFNPEKSLNYVNVRPELLCKALQYLQTTDEVVMKVFESSLSLENIPIEGISAFMIFQNRRSPYN